MANTFQLAASYTAPVSTDTYLFNPGQVYNSNVIPMSDPEVVHLLARGILKFADSTNILTYLADPVVKATVTKGNAKRGFTGPPNAYGV